MSRYYKNPEWELKLPDFGGMMPDGPDEWILLAAGLLIVTLWIITLFHL